MLWRCNWVKQRRKIIDALRFYSIQCHFPPTAIETGIFSRENSARFHGIAQRPLTHDNVYSYLRESTSDLKTLTFFFWCAKQNNYFHDDRAFDHMVGVLEKLTQDYNGIDRIIEDLKRSGFAVKPRVLLLLLEIFWRGHIYYKAIEVYIGMNSFGYVPNTRAMNMMMDVNFKLNLIDKALEIFEGIRVRNFFSFDIALSHLCNKGDLVKVKIVLKMMIREGFYPNDKRFGSILEVFCRRGCVSKGFQVVGLMICSGISVSVHVWSMLINGLFRSREPRKAIDLFNKMIQIGCFPNLVTYTSLIKGFMDLEMINEASSVLSIVQSRGLAPDILLCNVMIHTYTKLGRFEDAHNVFTNLERKKLVADKYTFALIVSNPCLSKDFKLLTGIANGRKTELDPVLGNSLLNSFWKAGDSFQAMKLMSHMFSRDLVDCYTYAGYLTALCRGGRSRDAIDVYKEMIRQQKIDLDAHVHTAIIDGLIELGKYNTAIHLFHQCVLKKYALDVVSYTVAIKGLVRAKKMDEACSWVWKMKEDGVFPNRRTYRTVISGLCEENENDKVKKMLRECIEDGVELDLNTKFKVFRLLSRSDRDLSEFRSVFEKWEMDFTEESLDVTDSGDDLYVSVG